MHSNKYILVYSTIMVVLVAVSLTFVAVGLKPCRRITSGLKKCRISLPQSDIGSTKRSNCYLSKVYFAGYGNE